MKPNKGDTKEACLVQSVWEIIRRDTALYRGGKRESYFLSKRMHKGLVSRILTEENINKRKS